MNCHFRLYEYFTFLPASHGSATYFSGRPGSQAVQAPGQEDSNGRGSSRLQDKNLVLGHDMGLRGVDCVANDTYCSVFLLEPLEHLTGFRCGVSGVSGEYNGDREEKRGVPRHPGLNVAATGQSCSAALIAISVRDSGIQGNPSRRVSHPRLKSDRPKRGTLELSSHFHQQTTSSTLTHVEPRITSPRTDPLLCEPVSPD